MDIPIDAKVQCTDGKCGKSTFVIVNPVKRVVTHFVVKDKKLPENPDRLVPVEKIADISEQPDPPELHPGGGGQDAALYHHALCAERGARLCHFLHGRGSQCLHASHGDL